jgi:ribosomal protein L11 methyltransferase
MDAETWLEVSLIVDGELAEAVSEVLARFVSGGVVIESIEVADGEDKKLLVGPLRVYGYLEPGANLAEKKRGLEQALWYLGRIKPLPDAQYYPVRELDWSQIWKKHFQPITVGRQLIVIPSWLEYEYHDRIPVRIDPGMAFGTGTHPTTQLCLQLLEESISELVSSEKQRGVDLPGMIDIGCGSGILSIAAAKLGVSHVLGVDLDKDAVEAARRNASANQVEDQVEFFTSSVDEIKAGMFSTRDAPLVTANILSGTLIRLLAGGLGDLVTPGGKLILSGILEDQVDEVEAAVESGGLRVEKERGIEDWRALVAVQNKNIKTLKT